MFKKILSTTNTKTINISILLLRVSVFVLLFYKHGIEKIFTFSKMQAIFEQNNIDPICIGKTPSLVFAMLTDSFCSLFIIIGLFTRIASVMLIINILVAFFLFHHAKVDDHGEMILLYASTLLFFIITGSGKYSLDNKFFNQIIL